MKNRKRKGFTIVELVIVIAIVAVLAGVLIPTFASIIDKANQSADIQAARQLNDALVIGSVENKPDDIEDVKIILAAAGYDSEKSLKPITTGYRFFWFAEENTIVLAQIPDFVDRALALDIPDNGVDGYEVKVVYPEGRDVEGSVAHKFETILNELVEILVNAGCANENYNWNVVTAEGLVGIISAANVDSDLFKSLSGLLSSNLWKPQDHLGENTPVSVPVDSVQISETLSLTAGNTGILTPTILPSDATNKSLNWVSSNTAVATVNHGVVIAVSAGEATITATTNDGSDISVTCTVTVTGGESGGGENTGGGNEGGGNEAAEITTADQLKAALAAGGDVTLGGNIVLEETVTIPAGATATINLGGNTLTFNDSEDASEVIGVAGALTIKDEAEGSGKVVLNANYTDTGINVEEGGTLTLENVSVDGSWCWNIANCGTTFLTNVQVTFPGGYGFANSGIATISECTFTATGEYGTTTIYNCTGTLNVSETTVGESGTVSYSNGAVVLVDDGAVYMDDVTVTTTATNTYSVFAKGSSQVTIKDDNSAFNTQFLCSGNCSYTIYGGTFYDGTNDVSYNDLSPNSAIFLGYTHNLTPGDNCWIIAPKS